MKRHQVAVASQPAFRKDADHVALLKGVARRAQRFHDGARSRPGVNGQRPHPAQHSPQAESLGPRLEDDESDRPLDYRQKENPIHVANMIRANQGRSVRGDVFLSEYAHAVD